MTTQDYIANRLAELRNDMPDPVSCPTLSVAQRSAISELEAIQAHLSQSTRPEASIGGQYSVSEGKSCSYLSDYEGFVRAQGFGPDIQRIASGLNQLEALRASHEQMRLLLARVAGGGCPSTMLRKEIRNALSEARSNSPNPTKRLQRPHRASNRHI